MHGSHCLLIYKKSTVKSGTDSLLVLSFYAWLHVLQNTSKHGNMSP